MDENPPAATASEAVPGDAPAVDRAAALDAVLTSGGIGAMAGALAGFFWGGIGGRLAMRILFLTSDERVRGITSDDGFEIGVITGATVFLLVFTAILGAMAGAVYGVLRMLLRGPRWLIAIGVGIAAAAGQGALVVKADGIDFRILEPLWLAVGLFLLITGAWGVSVVALTERLLRPGTVFRVLPSQIDRRYGGAFGSTLGWLALLAITTLGIIDLARDIAKLT
ncbi:MAG: hypothetical protein ACR2OI_08265 [Acidimicrobiia bacterium]